MTGVGKIHVEERRLVWIWTRSFTDWLRLKLWSWTALSRARPCPTSIALPGTA